VSCCPPSPTAPCPPEPRVPTAPPDAPDPVCSTCRTLVCNTEQTYTAERPDPVTVELVGVVVSYDGNLTITGSDGAFDDLEGATQVLFSGFSLFDGYRTVTVDVETNTIVIAAYHSKGQTIYAIDPETGDYLLDPETGDFIIVSEGLVPPGQYTIDITAVIGTTSDPDCSITVPAGTYCDECQDTANAKALASAQAQAEECIEDDPSLLYRNSDIEYTAQCPANSYGEYESTVAYNTYTSLVSQKDADQKALNSAIFEALTEISCGCGFDDAVWQVVAETGNCSATVDGFTFSGSLDVPALDPGTDLDVRIVSFAAPYGFTGVVRATVTEYQPPSIPDVQAWDSLYVSGNIGAQSISDVSISGVGETSQSFNIAMGDDIDIFVRATPVAPLAGSTNTKLSFTVELVCQ
jgi:hypothetical protein